MINDSLHHTDRTVILIQIKLNGKLIEKTYSASE